MRTRQKTAKLVRRETLNLEYPEFLALSYDPMSAPLRRLTKSEYQMLAAFRYHLRRFLQFSEAAAQAAGLTPRQYQALLAIKGSAQRESLTIGELAEQLQIVHHAAVELVDRLSAQNLVERHSSLEDRRKVFVKLSRAGSKILDKLSAAHRGELRRLSPGMLPLLENLISDGEARRGLRK